MEEKKNPSRCPKCGLTFSGKREYCPLCGKRIAVLQEEEDFDIFPVIPVRRENSIFLRVVTFIGLAAVILVCMLDQILIKGIGLPACLGILCSYTVLVVGWRKWKNVRKTVMYEAVIGMLICLLWDRYFGWEAWSVNYVIPLTVAGLNVLYFILGFADREHETDYGIYFLLTIIGTAAVIILMAAGVITRTKLPVVTTGIGLILLLAKVTFQGKAFFQELSRRLHV